MAATIIDDDSPAAEPDDEVEDDGPGTALAVRDASALVASGPRPLPPLVLARSLESAKPGTLVYIDRQGQVRSPRRYRLLEAISYGAVSGLVASTTAIYGALLGLPGVLFGLGLGLWFGLAVRRRILLGRASLLITHERFDEAEALLLKLRTSFRAPAAARALAEQNLGAIAARRGDFAGALERQRAALKLYARGGLWGGGGVGGGKNKAPRSAMAALAGLSEIMTLVNLDRTGEAQARLDQLRPAVPSGNYLQLQLWTTELYVAFSQGQHAFDDDALHLRARTALQVTAASALLGLLAWAHARAGDPDQALHLLSEALDRRSGQLIDRLMPKLHRWMEAEAIQHGLAIAREPADADDE